MKIAKPLLAIGAAFTLGLVGVEAQTTNVVMVANVSLTGLKQGSDSAHVTPVRISTRSLLGLLNASGNFNFSSGAKLVLVSQDDQLPSFAVRQRSGTNVTTTDISGFFSITETEELHANHNTKSYAVQTFNFDDHNGTTFSVMGLTLLTRGPIMSSNIGPLSRVNNLNSQVNGSGSIAGNDAVMRGTITANSAKAEVD